VAAVTPRHQQHLFSLPNAAAHTAVTPPSPRLFPAAADPGPQTGASRKLALVLGNSAYQRQPLRNPNNDARAMAKR